jgi:hypothetical protein
MQGHWFIFRTLLYLRLLSLWNFFRVSVRRLRQPRYLIGVVMILGYLWLLFLRPGREAGAAFGQTNPFSQALPLLAAFAVFVMIWLQWLVPGKPGLRFSEAEIAFLFPAPITRRQLIHYRLLDNLSATMLSALVFMLIFNGTRLGLESALRSWGAWWAVQAVMGFHGIAAALTLHKLANRGWSITRRRLMAGTIGFLYLTGLAALALSGQPEIARSLLWPTRIVTEPFFATPELYLLTLLPSLLVLALHYLWVLKLETPFEEASIEQAKKLADRMASYRAGKGLRLTSQRKKQNESFRLGEKLPMELALLWKNLMVAPTYMNRRIFIAVAAISTVGILWLQQQAGIQGGRMAAAIGGIALVLLGYLFAFGPQLATNDLRGELANADIVKTWPQPGWRIVLGSLLAPALQLSGIGWLFVLMATLGAAAPADSNLVITSSMRLTAGLCLAVMLPLLFALQLLVPNAFALMFPAWSAALRPGPGRLDIAGLRLLFFLAQFLFLGISLLPPLVIGGIAWYFSYRFFSSPVTMMLTTIPVLFILLLEFLYGVYLLGERFDQADLVAETR